MICNFCIINARTDFFSGECCQLINCAHASRDISLLFFNSDVNQTGSLRDMRLRKAFKITWKDSSQAEVLATCRFVTQIGFAAVTSSPLDAEFRV